MAKTSKTIILLISFKFIIADVFEVQGVYNYRWEPPNASNANHLTKYSAFHSIGEIEEKYRAYAQSNMLGFYSVRMQKCIQKLYTLNQVHVCDLIIRLTCQKRTQMRDNLLEQVERIDLQQLDHLTLIEVLPKNVHNKYSTTSIIYYQEENPPMGSTNETALKKGEKNINNQYGLRILNKYILKNKLKMTQQPFKTNYFFVIGTVGCFETQDVLKPSTLPTKKSPLRIFLEKVQGASIRYRTNILAVFIVSPQKQADFNKEVQAYRQQLKEDYFDTDEFQPPFIKIQTIPYRPIYPCVDSQRKIKLTADGNDMLFNRKEGDLLGFIMQEPVIQGLLQKYQFVQIANISNILEPIADRQILGYLTEHVQVDIVAPVIIEDDFKCKQTLKLNKYFVERMIVNPSTPYQKKYQLTQSFYLRTLLLNNKGSHFQKLIATRIKSKPLSQMPEAMYFYRTFQHVLYSPITLLLVTSKKNFSPPQRQQMSYSNYCKSILGISDTKDEEIVEICPQILFGAKTQVQQIIMKLRNLESVGFPLVLDRQKIQPFGHIYK